MGDKNEMIELSLPANAAYVSAARLTASSIANRLGFDIDETEDVKAAVSEACAMLIKLTPTGTAKHFKIIFDPGVESLTVRIRAGHGIDLVPNEGEMSLIMIRALMDVVEIGQHGGCAELRMVKRHQELFL